MTNETCERCKCKIERGSEGFKDCKVYCQICYDHLKDYRRGRNSEKMMNKFYEKWAQINK